MAAFPTLSKVPAYPLGEESEDAVIRSSSEAGYQITRPRFTKVRRKFEVKYEDCTQTDKNSLDTFYYTTLGNGSAIFQWTHPQTSEVINVRFAKPIKSSLAFDNHYNIEFTLEEV